MSILCFKLVFMGLIFQTCKQAVKRKEIFWAVSKWSTLKGAICKNNGFLSLTPNAVGWLLTRPTISQE